MVAKISIFKISNIFWAPGKFGGGSVGRVDKSVIGTDPVILGLIFVPDVKHKIYYKQKKSMLRQWLHLILWWTHIRYSHNFRKTVSWSGNKFKKLQVLKKCLNHKVKNYESLLFILWDWSLNRLIVVKLGPMKTKLIVTFLEVSRI